jgi:CRISPR-associated protein Cas2
MMVLVTYDVETTTSIGRTRLRKVAKSCVNYGQRVQNSVFECVLDPAQFSELKNRLLSIIDEEKDNLRFYFLGKRWESRVECYGNSETYNPESDSLII